MAKKSEKIAKFCVISFVALMVIAGAATSCFLSSESFQSAYFSCCAWIMQKCANRGSLTAQNFLGYAYEYGVGVETNDVEAARWYRKAAKRGVADAQYKLARMYQTGSGVNEDPARAVVLLRKAAERGYILAQNRLGLAYENGLGVDKDYGEAKRWYRKAAKRGYARAQNNLGLMYKFRNGGPPD